MKSKALCKGESSTCHEQRHRRRLGPFSNTRNLRRAFGSKRMRWLDDPETSALLRRIVSKATPDSSLHEELLQEALIHLWHDEQRHPGNSRSWYLQSCKFHVENYLRKGRSLDSPKRHNGKLFPSQEFLPNADGAQSGNPHNGEGLNGDVLSVVAEHEIVELLSKRLSSQDWKILKCLAQGLPVREVASKLKLSHTAVVKRRRKIADQARQLGVVPPSA